MAFDYLGTAAIGTEAAAITGKIGDGAAAAGYGAWIQSVTGSTPTVAKVSEGRAKIILSSRQVMTMQNWIDDQIFQSFKAEKDKPTLDIEFGPVLIPEVIKYAIILSGIGFIAGYLISKKF